jgi:hypothetical protein
MMEKIVSFFDLEGRMGDFRISIKIWVRPPVTRVKPDTYVSNKAILKI